MNNYIKKVTAIFDPYTKIFPNEKCPCGSNKKFKNTSDESDESCDSKIKKKSNSSEDEKSRHPKANPEKSFNSIL